MHDVLEILEENLEEQSAKGLARAVSRAIRAGRLADGDLLPPIRKIAAELCLSPTTVNAAWSLLSRSGFIHTDGRRGTRVSDRALPASDRYRHALLRQNDFDIDLSNGVPDPSLLPDLTMALNGVTTAASPGGYLGAQVLPELLDVLKDEWPYPAPAMTVVDGAMDAVELVLRARVRYGDRVIVENPTFPPIMDLLDLLGAQIIGVPLDGSGMIRSALADALSQPAAMVILQPRGQNPTGASMTESRARQLAEVIAQSDALVLEDDAAGCVAVAESVSLGKYIPDQVLHARSYSKSHGAELRVAGIGGPSSLIAEVESMRQYGQGWTSRILQRVLLNFLTSPAANECVDRARAEYARRVEVLRYTLDTKGTQIGPTDGINVWVPVVDEYAAIMRLAAGGIAVTPGSPFMTGKSQHPHIRVSIGLLRDDIDAVSEKIAIAARTEGWHGR